MPSFGVVQILMFIEEMLSDPVILSSSIYMASTDWPVIHVLSKQAGFNLRRIFGL